MNAHLIRKNPLSQIREENQTEVKDHIFEILDLKCIQWKLKISIFAAL
jgi:hypothetical protein